MKKTRFNGLALTLGISLIPNVASAQYQAGNQGTLPASSFNANLMGNPPNAGMRLAPQKTNPTTTLAAYAQNGTVGSGISNEHVHVPEVPTYQNSVLPPQYPPQTQYSPPQYSNQQYASPQYGAQQAPAYEQVQVPQPTPPVAMGNSSCPACNSGNCAAHGVGGGSSVMTLPSQASAASCYSEPAISYGPALNSPSPWIFGASGLLFNRVDHQNVRLTSDSNMPSDALLSTSDARMQSTGGVQVSAGRYFGDGRYAMIASYWGIFSNPITSSVQAPVGGNLRSNLPFTLRNPNDTAVPGNPYGITMPGQTVYDWYDGAFAHRVVRDQQFNNVELNFFSFALGGGARQPYALGCGTSSVLGGRFAGGYGAGRYAGGGSCGNGACGPSAYGSCGDPCGSSCGPTACAAPCGGPTGPCAPWYGAQCSKLRLNMYGGVRWFQFRDQFEYAASTTDAIYGTGPDDFYYRNGVKNDLLGFQLGSMATWCTGTRFNLYAGTAFGIYGNHMSANTFAGSNGTAATIMSTNTFNGMPYDYSSSKTDIAFLGEGNIGTGIRLGKGWTANLGYRVVGVNGVATAVGQIPRDFTLGNDLNRINNYNSLILHGVVLGAMYNF